MTEFDQSSQLQIRPGKVDIDLTILIYMVL